MTPGRARAWVALSSLALVVCAARFVLRNNLLEHDLAGHLSMATFIREHLWPRAAGWDPRFFCGTPIGQWYPPLVAWLAATLGFAVGVPLALKLVVALAVVATPPALYAFARGYGLSPAGAALATVAGTAYLALDRQELGANFHSTFIIGNVTNGVVLPLMLLALASLPSIGRGSFCAIVRPALLVALVLVTHLVAAMVVLGFVAVERGVATYRDRKLAPPTLAFLALAFSLSAFFCVPLVRGLGFGARTPYSYNQYPTTLLESALVYALLVAVFVRARRRSSPDASPEASPVTSLAAPAIALGLLFVGQSFVFNDFLPAAITLHVHRFTPYARLFALVLVAGLVAPLAEKRAATVVLALGVAAAFIGATRLPSGGVANPPLPPLPSLDARVMVVSSPESEVSDHALQHLVPLRSNNDVGKGLFIELGANAPYLLDLERVIAEKPVRAWGVQSDDPADLTRLPSLAAARLAHLGFGWILANEPIRDVAGIVRDRALGDGFTLHRIGTAVTPLEIWRGGFLPATNDFELRARAWFLGAANEKSLPIRAAESPPPAADGDDARVTSWRRDRDGQWLDFDVSRPSPVLVKTTFAPDWRAEDAAGRALSLFEAAPHLMIVAARDHVRLRYAPASYERALDALAFVAAVICIALATICRLRRRAR
jgi:hypothetical protein